MKIIKLLLAGVFVLGVSNTFAAKQEKEEATLVGLPLDIKKYLIPFIMSAPDFPTAAKNVEGLAANKEYGTLFIEALRNRFLKNLEEAKLELAKLSARGELSPFMLEVLRAAGVDANMEKEALKVAARYGHKAVVDMLVEAIDPITKTHGDTALTWAVRKNFPDIITALINEKAYLDKQDKNGNTALIIAADNGYANIVEMLIKAGANPNIKNILGDTALSVAESRGYKEIAKMLKKAKVRKFIPFLK